MKLAVRLLTLALCAFAWYENTLLVNPKPCDVKPSAAQTDSIFHNQVQMWIETLTIGGVGLPACPSNKKCV